MTSLNSVGKKIAKLPSLDHLTMEDFDHVYEPSDDTFLLCDALENDRERIAASCPDIVLEVGCGSGCVITFLSKLLKEEKIPCLSLATDINLRAAAVTLRTAKENEVIQNCYCFLYSSFCVRVLFNPRCIPLSSPYPVPIY